MSRGARVWAIYALCVAAAGAALAGVTWSALATERAGLEAQDRAALEGATRVALYRMDSSLASLIGVQAARPVDRYLEPAPPNEFSSAFTDDRYVRLRFEMQGPDSIRVDNETAPLAAAFRERIAYEPLVRALRKAEADVAIQTASMPPAPVANEWQNRAQSNIVMLQNDVAQQALARPDFRTGLMTPVWCGAQLLLVRRVTANAKEVVQGCWLDWDALRPALEQSVSDLLPTSRLAPIDESAGPAVAEERRLAALPAYIEPGPPTEGAHHTTGPLRRTLLLAWICGATAAIAVGVLLGTSLALSERRATFVSAVTHEMRTPLTTFRLYADLLAEGRVTDDAKRQRYYETLRAEAVRLGHLVENVLAYARIERRKNPGVLDSVCVNDALDRLMESLVQRAAQSGREVKLEGNDKALATCVHIDVAAFERILMNLVDNACKHGTPARDPLIRISVAREGHWMIIRVADTGPGVPPDVARRLFRAFGRSAHEAAGAAPGIGLGLALSRRLARHMRGDLRLEPNGCEGASLALKLLARSDLDR